MHQKPSLKPEPMLQCTLFETDEEGKYTNTVDLFDIAPRFVFYTESTQSGAFVPSIRREFEHAGVPYQILLRPGRATKASGEEVERFPGEREQIIEAVVLRLATERGRLSVHGADGPSGGDDAVRLSFSMHKIFLELQKYRHTFNLDEVKQALTILHTSVVEITKVDKHSKRVLSSSAFPVLALRQRGEVEDAYLEFNPMVKNAIKQLRYRHMNYEWLMEIKNAVSRWLYKRLCQSVVGLCDWDFPVVTMTAMEIYRDCGLPPRSRHRDGLGRIRDAVRVLVARGIIENVKPLATKSGRAVVDLTYDFVPSARFLAEIRRADRIVEHNRQQLRVVAGTDAPDVFLRAPRSVSHKAKMERSREYQADLGMPDPVARAVVAR